MDNDQKQKTLLRISALVDGELAPAERAELAAEIAIDNDLARAYATLARLKAVTAEDAIDMPEISIPQARRSFWSRRIAAGAALAAVLAIALFAELGLRSGRDAAPPDQAPTEITLASLPAGTTIPRLDAAGLTLSRLSIDPGPVPILTAIFRGPHGCRLDFRAWPAGSAVAPLEGSVHKRWTVGDLAYELVAHGMPGQRFNTIADAAEMQTRLNTDHNRINRRLQQAKLSAPPCVG
jgi:hypothetical protein